MDFISLVWENAIQSNDINKYAVAEIQRPLEWKANSTLLTADIINRYCTEPETAAMLLDIADRANQVSTEETSLSIIAQAPIHADCEMLTVRYATFGDDDIPRLVPDGMWMPRGGTVQRWEASQRLDDESLAIVWMMSGGPSLFISNTNDFALFTDDALTFYQNQGIQSLYRVLLKDAGEGFAILTAMWKHPQTFTPKLQAQIECLCRLVAPIIKKNFLKQSLATSQRRLGETELELHSMAHDLKTPLTTVISTTSILETYIDRLTDEQVSQKLTQILRAGTQMNDWIQNILLLANATKMEQIQLDSINPAETLTGAIETLDPMLKSFDAHLSYTSPYDDLPPLLGLPIWVEHVWLNYISNALKYGGQPPHIHLGAERIEGAIRLTIHDNGPGIAPDKLESTTTS